MNIDKNGPLVVLAILRRPKGAWPRAATGAQCRRAGFQQRGERQSGRVAVLVRQQGLHVAVAPSRMSLGAAEPLNRKKKKKTRLIRGCPLLGDLAC